MKIKETVYTHHKKNGSYVITDIGEVQENQKWFPCIIYKSLDTGKVYVRKEDEFNSSFKVIRN